MGYSLYDQDIARHLAATFMDIGAISLNTTKPFTWASGWKSPIYCDNRLSLSYPEVRSYVKNKLTSVIQTHFQNVEVIAGVATAGIPQGILVAENMNLPFNYVRSNQKDHGLQNLIEGRIEPGKHVVVIEDLVSTGSSSLNAVKALRDAGFIVSGMAAIFTYGFKAADDQFDALDTPLVCLSSYAALLEEALKRNYITVEQLELLKAWRVDPVNWKGK